MVEEVQEVQEEDNRNLIPIRVKMSHYTPQAGGTNCYNFVNGECLSKMSVGIRWQEWYNLGAVACPAELPFWTEIIIEGKTYTCLDRGGAIVINGNGEYWIDILGDAIAPYGAVLDGYIIEKE